MGHNGSGQRFGLTRWVGSGWVKELVGWVGSGHKKVTHGQLCVGVMVMELISTK